MATKTGKEVQEHGSLLTEFDIHLFKAGRHYKLYEKLGSHIIKHGGKEGTYFAVWAPNARSVSVIGNFNLWNSNNHKLSPRWDESGHDERGSGGGFVFVGRPGEPKGNRPGE